MLSEALRLIRVFHHVKQNELAARLGISKSYLSEIENAIKSPTMELIEKYSREFEIPASSILFFSERLNDNAPAGAARARGMIARKVLTFLKAIENRTQSDAEEDY